MTDEKQRYYSDKKVVREYDRRRFVRGGGRYVAEVEMATVRELLLRLDLKPGAVALDCPTGTGRFLPLLRDLQLRTIAVDLSSAMLEFAARVPEVRCLQAAADALPMEAASVNVWLMSRFAFHFADLRSFFREAARVVVPGGSFVFDVYQWTPRQWIPGSQNFIGGRVHTHSHALIARWLEEVGFRINDQRPTFFLAPYLYSFMPAFLARWLDRASDRIAPGWKTKTYFVARKAS